MSPASSGAPVVTAETVAGMVIDRAVRNLVTRRRAAAAISRVSLLDWQRGVVSGARRFNTICVGRQAGKTTLGVDLAIDAALDGTPVGWWSPTYRMLLDAWRALVDIVAPITTRRVEQSHRVELETGGSVEFWSLVSPDRGRGRRYGRAIVDEAAMVPDLLHRYNAVIRPTLARHSGDAWFLSTPRGFGDFYVLYQRGTLGLPGWYSFRAPTSVNPAITADEIEAMRASMPASEFAQEILAEFVSDSGLVFRGVPEATSLSPEPPVPGRRYVAGVDLAISGDYTVITILDVTDETARQVLVDRWTGIPWRQQLDRLSGALLAYNPDIVEIDRTGLGDMVVDELSQMIPAITVHGVRFNAGNKQSMVQGLALGLEQGRLRLIDDPVQTAELIAYEAARRDTGTWAYGAPDGAHDDTVSALMLAWDAATAEPWGVIAL